MPHQTDDAPTPSRDFPPNPYSPTSPRKPTKHAGSDTIDLTSPTRSSPGSKPLGKRPHAAHTRPPFQNRRSADEKRLIGDYKYGACRDTSSRRGRRADLGNSVPADRVNVPDPSSYFSKPQMVKPAHGKGFQPVNTLESARNPPTRPKQVTYGHSSSNRPPRSLIFDGQTAFLEKWSDQHQNTPKSSKHREQTSRSRGQPSAKKRKTGHSSPPEVIDLEADDLGQEVSPLNVLAAPDAPRSPQLSRSRSRSRSRCSNGSGPQSARTQLGSQPKNEFRGVENFVTTNRKITTATADSFPPSAHSHLHHSASRSATPRAHDASILIPDDLPVRTIEPARKKLLEDFKQGVPARAPEKDPEGAETSRHFPNARINESTSESDDQTTGNPQVNGHSNDLRAFRRAGAQTTETDPISDDELGIGSPGDKKNSTSRRRSPAKPSQAANKGAKRTPEKRSEIWPLTYARTHGYEGYGAAELKKGNPVLALRSGPITGSWRIVAYGEAEEGSKTRGTIEPSKINKVTADDVSRMRLEGPRGSDGSWAIFDLDFQDTKDFLQFREKYATPMSTLRKCLIKTKEHMAILFRKDLHTNDKVGASLLLNDTYPGAEEQSTSDTHPSKPPLWTQMKSNAQKSNSLTSKSMINGTTRTSGPSQASARSARSTRSTAPDHDAEDVPKSREIEKFSISNGLGTPWLRPLTYGDGGQRASIYFEDLPRLDEEEFLNDSLIDFYMIYLSKQYKLPQHKVFFFNTYFFTKLTQNTGRGSMNYQNVARWTSKVDIFEYDYIIVPINEDIHWYLAIICNVDNIKRKPVQEDFDGIVVNDVTDVNEKLGEQVNAVEPVESEISAVAELAHASGVSTPSKSSLGQEQESDVNLFDEESKLDLINRDDTEPTEERIVSAEASSIPQSPQSEGQHKAKSIFDQGDPLKTIYSSLKGPTEKKKPKRKSMGPKKDPTQPVIIILDSMTQTRSHTVRALKDWLAAEGMARRGMEATIKEKGFYPKAEQIPTQNNFTDCGVYVLGYAAKFFQDPDEFKRKLLTGEMTATEDWPELKPKEMRKDLRDLLFSLAQEQKLTVPAKKKKKEKKSVTGAKSSPTQTDAESPANSKPRLFSDREPENLRSAEIIKLLAEATPPVHAEETQPIKNPVSRLGSPFEGTEPLAWSQQVNASVGTQSKASRSPIQKTVTASPQKQTPVRRTHPEVRIPGPTPPSQQSHISRRQGHQASRSTSPLKRVWQAAEDNEEYASPKKKQNVETQQLPRTSPGLSQTRQGNSDHPIEIQDSQEFQFTATQSPHRLHLGSPVQRRHNTRLSPTSYKLRHEPSIEEFSFSPPEAIPPRKKIQPGEQDISTLLEASLNADDQARNATKRGKSRSAEFKLPSTGPEHADETVFDLMDVDSQGVDLMDTAEDGTFVRETPEPARRSPPLEESWVSGRALLH